MITCTIIETATGAIDSILTVPDESFVAMNTPAGCEALPGAPSNPASYWDGMQWVAIPAQPNAIDVWNPATKQWVDPRTLAQAQSDQCNTLDMSYAADIVGPVTFTTAGGVTQSYQADPQSLNNATFAMLGCQAAQAVPAGFFWVAEDNTQVPFTYADLQGLAAAMFARGQPAFVRLQALKTQVRAATTLAQVQAVTW